jgi:hypothetical protein
MNESRIFGQLLSGTEHICPEPELDILYLDKQQSFRAIQDDSDSEMTESLFLLFCLDGQMQIRSYFKDNYYEQTVQQGWYALQYCPKGSQLEYLVENRAERILLHIVPHCLLNLIADQRLTQEIRAI